MIKPHLLDHWGVGGDCLELRGSGHGEQTHLGTSHPFFASAFSAQLLRVPSLSQATPEAEE